MKPLDDSLLIGLECLPLSKAECSVAKLLAHGYSQKEIADRLCISPLTVKTHLNNIYRELDIHKGTDLVRIVTLKECGYTSDPFKKILAVFFLTISIVMLLPNERTVRLFRSAPLKTAEKVEKPVKERRFRNVFEIQYC